MAYELHKEKIWDPVTRIWHWALAASVITGWCLGQFRSFSIIEWHFYFGYTTGGLIVFRYLWGFFGPAPIRYRTLFATLPGLMVYVRHIASRDLSGTPGHNPLGVLSIIAIVLALTLQVISGLFSEDDGLFSSGPLASEVTSSTVRLMTRYHNLGSKVILALVGLHVGAIVFYLIWKRENLVTPDADGLEVDSKVSGFLLRSDRWCRCQSKQAQIFTRVVSTRLGKPTLLRSARAKQ